MVADDELADLGKFLSLPSCGAKLIICYNSLIMV